MTPLSHQQKRLWYIDQLQHQTPASNIVFSLNLKGPLDSARLSKALQQLVEQQSVLSAEFDNDGTQPALRQRPVATISLSTKNLQQTDNNQQRRYYEQFANQSINLSHAPLFRFDLVQLAADQHQLLCLFHQAIFDQRAITLFCSKLFNYYQGNDNKSAQESSAEQHKKIDNSGLKYWQDQLDGTLPALELPTEFMRPAQQSFGADVIETGIDRQTTTALKKLAERLKLSTETLLLAAFSVLMSRYSRQNDLIVGLHSQQHNNSVTPINQTLPVRFKIDNKDTFSQFASYVAQQHKGFIAHQTLPFETLVQSFHDTRDLSLHPLYQCSFFYQTATLAEHHNGQLSINALHHYYPKALVTDIALTLEQRQDELRCVLQFATDLFQPDMMRQWLNHFARLLEQLIQHSESPLYALNFMSEDEHKQQLIDWNQTELALPKINNFTSLISEQAQRHAEKDAAIFNDVRISYSQLEQQSNQLAHYLIAQGAGPNKIIGLALDRSIEMLIGLLGILKSGAAYLPLDPDYPAERIRYILQDAQVELLVSDQQAQQRLPSLETNIILLDTITDILAQYGTRPPHNNLSPQDSAYVIYTSGSTGQPKGVDVCHRNVVNFLLSMRQRPGLIEDDVLLAVTTISFDISVLELYLPLISGATVVIASREEAVDGHALLALIGRHQVTTIQATPASWRLLIQAGWTNKHGVKALCGGEALSRELGQELLKRASSVWNMYGPTETTVWSSCDQLSLEKTNISIGRPIHNTQFYVLDEHKHIVPTGVNGELYIGGEGVTKGYLHKAELSAERFIADPFSDKPNAQLYRTGDLVRYQADGRIKYLHRIDNQIKLRGFRIELGEIESALLQHEAIQQAVASIRSNNSSEPLLVAHVVYQTKHSATVSELRRFLQSRLPDYMVPSLYVNLAQLPLTPSGKVDKKALPDPFSQGQAQHHIEPRTESERYLVELWQRVLNQPKISVQANFFDQGGHSLLSMSVIAQIKKEHHIDVPPRAMIMDTLEQIAANYFTSDTTAAITPTAAPNSNAFFFGRSAQALYGVYHPGNQAKAKKAVLLCYPYGHEYMRIHWAFRRLTEQLNLAGYPVLRFDYSGTGDSAGDAKAVSITQWQQDIVTAVKELQIISGATQLSIIGYRLGATLAASTTPLSIDNLVLWEPLVTGEQYLDEMQAMNLTFIQRLNKFRRHKLSQTDNYKVGMAFPDQFQTELRQLDITAQIPEAKNVYFIHSNQDPDIDLAYDYFKENRINSWHIHCQSQTQWNTLTKLGEAITDTDGLHKVMSIFQSKNK